MSSSDKIVKRLTPEQVAMRASMKSQKHCSTVGSNYSDQNNQRWASMRGNKNASITSSDRTPEQQETYVYNLRYRVKYQARDTRIRIMYLEDMIKKINPNEEAHLYAKIDKQLKKNEARLEEILMIKESYGF